jgi:hypothetical protein
MEALNKHKNETSLRCAAMLIAGALLTPIELCTHIRLDTWVLERMHLLVKDYCESIKLTRTFEKSVIRRAVAERHRKLSSAKSGNFLVGGSVPFPELSRFLQVEAMVGRHLTISTGQQFHIDDVVFPNGDRSDCALIKACFSGEGVYGLVLESLQLVTNVLIGPDEP